MSTQSVRDGLTFARVRHYRAIRFGTLATCLGIDAGGTKTVCQLAERQRGRARRGAAWRREPSGVRRARSREGAPRGDAGGASAIATSVPSAICLGIAGVDRPEDARVVARHHAADRLQGPRSSSSTTRSSRWRPARRTSPASSSSPAPGRSPTAGTPATRPRAPADGVTCSATRAAATGSAAPRCGPCCARPIAAGRERGSRGLLLQVLRGRRARRI